MNINKCKEKILVVVPAYNEAENIVDVIESIVEAYPNFDVLVVNDGSKDHTSELAKATQKCQVVDLPFNLGIGGCVKTGLQYACDNEYDIAVQFDGDGQHLISEIEIILGPIIEGTADCVIGSRFVQDDESYRPTSIRMLGIKLLRLVSYLIIKQYISDQTSGFRSYNKKAFELLAYAYPDQYPEPEIIVTLGKNDFRIKEKFTEMRERQGGISSIPVWKGPYYILSVLLAMLMASYRIKKTT